MLKIEASAALLAEEQSWFPPEIENDPWVVYHGTSSVFEEKIEQSGIQCGSLHLNDAILRCATLIKTTEWYEDNATASLVAFSFPRIISAPHFYCALFPQRASLYTRRMFAGGESAYFLRRIIPKLVETSKNNLEFFDSRFKKLMDNCIKKARRGMPTHDKVLKVNIEWFKKSVDELNASLPKLLEIERQHRYGVIYAIKLDPEDVAAARYFHNDGFRVYKPIPHSKCIAKLIIHGEHELSAHTNPAWDDINYWRDESVLVKSVKTCGYRTNAPDRNNEIQLIDLEGAEDMRFQIMIEHGNEMLRNFAIEQKGFHQRLILNSAKNL
jgi:hypothetical protein